MIIFFDIFLVQDVQAEGKHAIDSPGSPTAPEIPPEEYSLRKLSYICLVSIVPDLLNVYYLV